MFIIKFFVAFAASLLFLNQSWGSLGSSDSSTLADGNSSIGCNMQHGIDYNEQEEARKIVAYIVSNPKEREIETKADSVD